MARPIQPLFLSAEQRSELRRIVSHPAATPRQVRRAWIVLHRADGLSQMETARRVGCRRSVVIKWERRFGQRGLAGLEESPRCGRNGAMPEALKAKALAFVLPSLPLPARWSADDIVPHRRGSFEFFNGPEFWDVIGLYLNPPDQALVLCCDENGHCRTGERVRPGFSRACAQTYGCSRPGMIALFAALNYLDGKISSQRSARPAHGEWLSFLEDLDRGLPAELTLHLIVNHHATQQRPKAKAWLKLHPRFHLHPTPANASWMDGVERFFHDLKLDAVRKESFGSVDELVQAAQAYLLEHNLFPRRYAWRAAGPKVLAKIQRVRAANPDNLIMTGRL